MPRGMGASDCRFTSDELRSIAAVAEYGNVTAAAASLHVSQSAVSRVIARVEKTAGVRLFDRTTRQLQITTAGQDFVAIAERMLADFQLVVQGMRTTSPERHGRITLTSFPVVIQDTLPRLIRDFRIRYPKVDFNIRSGQTGIEDVMSGLSDFAIWGGPVPDVVDTVVLREEPLVAIFPAKHPLAKSTKSIHLQELAALPFVDTSRRTPIRDLLDAAAAAARVTFHVAVRVPEVADVVSYVRAGIGFGIIPIGAVTPPHRGLAVRMLAGPVRSVKVVLLQLRERRLSPIASAFRELVINSYRRGAVTGQRRRPY